MSSKIVGWLVGAQNGKIQELILQSEINKNPGINPVLLINIFSKNFQEFHGFSKIQELVLFGGKSADCH